MAEKLEHFERDGKTVLYLFQKLAEVLSEEARKMTVKDFPVVRHNQLMRIIHNENLELDEDELKQVNVTPVTKVYQDLSCSTLHFNIKLLKH